MSIKQYPGGIVTKNPTAPTTSVAQGIWTLDQAQNYTKQGIWPRSPGAPTIGTATAGSSGCASVTFTAPSCVGNGALTYSVVSTPGCFTNTGSSSPVVVSGLTTGTSYTFKAYGVTPGGTGPGSAASNSITAANAGSQSYTTAGTYSWVAPTGVTSVSVVAVGGGGGGRPYAGCPCAAGGGGGGGLGYRNSYAVTPGNSYTVVVGAGGTSGGAGTDSYFVSTANVKGGGGGSRSSNGGVGGTYAGNGGGNGGNGNYNGNGMPTGGGAGGYAGTGGAGGTSLGTSGGAGSGGGAGGGAGYGSPTYRYTPGAGVGLFGQGSNGAGATIACCGTTGTNATGGSGGCNAATNAAGVYGGGGGHACAYGTFGAGAKGAVRIIWPGNTRTFPSTCTGSP